ncbi:hypothetical protein ES708_26823 [subsurface metagenome]
MSEGTDPNTDPNAGPTRASGGSGEGTQEPKATDFLNEDGTFKPGYIDALVPEDLRKSAVYAAAPNLKDALKMLGHQERQIGKQGKGIMPLGENPTATDVEMYRKAMGIPETPEGYKVEVPEGLGDYYDEAVMKDTLAAFHAAHLTPGQVAAVIALDAKRLQAGIKEQGEAEAGARAEVEAALREEWGEKYDGNLRLANRVIAENVADADKDEILAVIGNDAKIARLFAKLGAAFLEDKPVNTDGERPSGIQSEIDRLEATPGFVNGELKEGV